MESTGGPSRCGPTRVQGGIADLALGGNLVVPARVCVPDHEDVALLVPRGDEEALHGVTDGTGDRILVRRGEEETSQEVPLSQNGHHHEGARLHDSAPPLGVTNFLTGRRSLYPAQACSH